MSVMNWLMKFLAHSDHSWKYLFQQEDIRRRLHHRYWTWYGLQIQDFPKCNLIIQVAATPITEWHMNNSPWFEWIIDSLRWYSDSWLLCNVVYPRGFASRNHAISCSKSCAWNAAPCAKMVQAIATLWHSSNGVIKNCLNSIIELFSMSSV